jgi:hypothetical protein
VHTLPAALPFRIGQETTEHLGIQVALTFEIFVESPVRQARTGHNLRERYVLEAVPVEQLACALNDFLSDLRAVTRGIGITILLL